MSKPSKIMPVLDLKVFVRLVAAAFSISSGTAFVMALMRLLNPQMFYVELESGTSLAEALGSNLVIHYLISGLMVVTSAIGFLNSCVVLNRSSADTTTRNITTWLLFDSLFETTRVVYVFVGEIVLKGKGYLQIYELIISGIQYLVDSFLYCQVILRH